MKGCRNVEKCGAEAHLKKHLLGVLSRRQSALSRPLCAAEGVSPCWTKRSEVPTKHGLRLLRNKILSIPDPEIKVKGGVEMELKCTSFLKIPFPEVVVLCDALQLRANLFPSGLEQRDRWRSVGQPEGKRSSERRCAPVHSGSAQARHTPRAQTPHVARVARHTVSV